MKNRWLAGILVGGLAASASVRAEDTPQAASQIALLPQTPAGPPERPTELPNIDPRLDIVPLIRTPNRSPAEQKRIPLRERLFGGDYDPSYLFLPDRNPGLRQPPCPCLPLGTWWVNAAYFLGVTESSAVPPLATSGGNGILGSPGVTTVHGDDRLGQPFRSGMRIEGGTWLDRCHTWGIDGSFFFMQATNSQYQTASNGDPLLGRPVIEQTGNTPGVNVLAAPGLSQGSLTVNSPLTFIGADVNSRRTWLCEDNYRIDFLVGYRFIRMTETVDVRSHSQSSDGTTTDIQDWYRSLNTFNGGQIGWAGEYRFDRLYLAAAAKMAFGVNWSTLDVEGFTHTQLPNGLSASSPGGLLANRSVLGTTREAKFAVAPEANFTVGYQVTDNWRAYLGYTFIYISSVARPGQAIDLNLGATIRPDPATEFWMHGINVGVEARY